MVNGIGGILFWGLLLLSFYSYFIYPLLLRALLVGRGGLGDEAGAGGSVLPSVTLIITAHNEASRIRDKLDNTLGIDYPGEQMEVIVASDCSSDDTDDIVREYTGRGVRLVRAGERLGKEHAQECAIREARGDILVFSDVATRIPPEAIRNLVEAFGDPKVGAVSSEDRFISQDGGLVGEGAYVRYEMWLRRMESRLAGLVGLSGSFFAARKEVCAEWDIHSPSDFNTALNCARLNLKAVTAPDVLGYYQNLKDPGREYQRKLRTVLRGVTGLARHPELLNPFGFGLFAFQVWSHKLMRWLVPWFLLALFLVTLAIYDRHWFYTVALWGQLAFYGVALAGHLNPGLRGRSVVRIIYFFVQVNVAIAQATLQFLAGRRMTTWQPSAR
jgi:cellulose synthase/poly-beta-1,6-N-acetylglucosamine synthase-like glycosyltransferase